MGLDIRSKSKFEYSKSYGRLHFIRYIAYLVSGGTKKYEGFMSMWNGYFAECDVDFPQGNVKLKEGHYDWAYFLHTIKFPNLVWHSDCDGSYTKTGKVAPFDGEKPLLTGSSIGLLKELEVLKKYEEKYPDQDWETFTMFYNVVKDSVEHHDGKIEFC